jgi:hypothetical protein
LFKNGLKDNNPLSGLDIYTIDYVCWLIIKPVGNSMYKNIGGIIGFSQKACKMR